MVEGRWKEMRGKISETFGSVGARGCADEIDETSMSER